jgi:hypothetical protein
VGSDPTSANYKKDGKTGPVDSQKWLNPVTLRRNTGKLEVPNQKLVDGSPHLGAGMSRGKEEHRVRRRRREYRHSLKKAVMRGD